VITGVSALYANYHGEPLALVDWCIYAALAITLLSGADYVYRMMRPAGTPAA
jgi:hypothetical protein